MRNVLTTTAGRRLAALGGTLLALALGAAPAHAAGFTGTCSNMSGVLKPVGFVYVPGFPPVTNVKLQFDASGTCTGKVDNVPVTAVNAVIAVDLRKSVAGCNFIYSNSANSRATITFPDLGKTVTALPSLIGNPGSFNIYLRGLVSGYGVIAATANPQQALCTPGPGPAWFFIDVVAQLDSRALRG